MPKYFVTEADDGCIEVWSAPDHDTLEHDEIFKWAWVLADTEEHAKQKYQKYYPNKEGDDDE